MTTIAMKDWYGNLIYLDGTGAGTAASPFVLNIAAGAGANVKDAGIASTTALGVLGAVVKSDDMSTATVVTGAPASGKKIIVDDLVISIGSTAMEVSIEEETTGTELFYWYAQANQVYHLITRGTFMLPTADKKLCVDTSAAGAIAVTCLYHSSS